MHKIILVLTVGVTTFGCSMPDSDIPISQAPSASTTNATPGIIPTPIETLPKLVSTPLPQIVPTPLPKLPELLTAPTQTLSSSAVSAPIGVKSSVPVATTTSTSQFNAAVSSKEKQVSTVKLIANIRKNIGCGEVDKQYQIQVMAIAIAQSNPKATQKLTEDQFYQAVRQTITEDQAQANNLVAQYRASNCGIASKQQSKVASVKPTVAPNNKTGTLVPEQPGNCKELGTRGITNIDVKANPWASRLDRDNDGVACEAN
jgi:hypothetical protein